MTDALAGWASGKEVDATDGGVFWLDPKSTTGTAKNGPVLLAQLTLKKSFSGQVRMGLVGKTTDDKTWRDNCVEWQIAGPPPNAVPGVVELPNPDKRYKTFQLNVTLQGNASSVYGERSQVVTFVPLCVTGNACGSCGRSEGQPTRAPPRVAVQRHQLRLLAFRRDCTAQHQLGARVPREHELDQLKQRGRQLCGADRRAV
jgi:hypothetical protein